MEERFFIKSKPVIQKRGIHLDLKGLPPTPLRFLEILDILKESRINCVLIEWEDSYPWKTYPELQSKTAYSISAIKKFLEKAEKNGIEVIPLVQSFGHLENVLSKRRFKHLREIPDNVGDICPLKPGSQKVILDMVNDILLTHKNIKYFHLGGDEVWTFGSCEKCKDFIEKKGKPSLYLYHLEPILDFLNSKGIRPIIWDDMIRKWSIPEIKKIGAKTDLLCWSYGKDPFIFVTKETIEKFTKAGCRLWAGSAYKGADGAYVDIPNLQTRITNMLEWVRYAKKIKMQGVIATGWSRYNTFLSPCEGIEASLDSLVLSGKIAWDGNIPQNPSEWAQSFLKLCEKKGINTKHFAECQNVSKQIQSIRDTIFIQARNYLQQAHLSGEPERINPFRAKQAKKALIESLKKLKSLAKEWENGHKGLIPEYWIKRYTLSRLEPARKIIQALIKGRIF